MIRNTYFSKDGDEVRWFGELEERREKGCKEDYEKNFWERE
jgi:hypothetical protein